MIDVLMNGDRFVAPFRRETMTPLYELEVSAT